MKKLAIISTHPIQYYAPLFRLLAGSGKIEIKVFYTWGEDSLKKRDPGFGKIIEWDIPLLNGYDYEFLKNTSHNPGSSHFKGIKNPEIIGRLKEFNPDSILVFGWANQSHLQVMRYFKGKIPVWFRGDSTLLDRPARFKGIIKSKLKKLFLSWVYKHADKAFYVGANNKSYFLEYGLKESQLIFAPHAIDNERFGLDRNIEVAKLRIELNIAKDELLILFAGKFESKKDPLLLLETFLKLNPAQVHLLFIGNGILEKELKDQANSHPRIHFRDFQNQNQMPVFYQACDLFCLPSKGPGETWGLAVNEAMACGKAVLVSDKVGCAIDLVKQHINGAIFKSSSGLDLHEQLMSLITKDKNGLKKMGEASLHIINDWTILKQAKAIETTLLNQV